MLRSHPFDDRARRWRRFCRKGRQMAVAAVVLWFGFLCLGFRVATPEPPPPPAPVAPIVWWPAPADAELDVRATWTPSAFALSSPAGFSHAQRGERAQLAPPVQAVRAPMPGMTPPAAPSFDLLKPGPIRLAGTRQGPAAVPSDPVFSPRTPDLEPSKMVFPEGWESRLFSGIDRTWSGWSDVPWSAEAEVHFNDRGIPVSVLLSRSSGQPEVDRRLSRSLGGWRLLDADAPRSGRVAWSCPVPNRPAAAAAGEGDDS